MNITSLVLGAAAMRDKEYFLECTANIVHTREWAKEEFLKLGFCFPDSMANFLFVTHPHIPAKELFEALKEHNIYVRYFDKPRIDNYLRITIGTDEEMDALLYFLRDYISRRDAGM